MGAAIGKNRLSILKRISLVLLMSLVIPLFFNGCQKDLVQRPRFENGVIDFSDWDFAQKGPVHLDGDWEFYWQKLLLPEDLNTGSPAEKKRYLSIDSMWQKQSKNNPGLTEKGFATFALTLTNIPAKTPLILRINSLMGAYTIFIDGSLVLKNGVAGATDEMQIQGKIGTKLIHLPFQSGIKPVTRIVVQVSKFFQVAGGAQFSFELGTTDKIETKWEHERMLLAFSAAMLFIIGCYHTIFFFSRRQDLVLLYFALFCFLWMTEFLINDMNHWMGGIIFQGITVKTAMFVDFCSYLFSTLFIALITRELFPEETPSFLLPPLLVMIPMITLLYFFADNQMGELVYLFSYIIVVAAFLVYLIIIPRAVLAGREGSLLLLFGYILVMVCGINDILFDLRLVYTARILPIGLLFYISLHSGLLAIRFASALTVSEDLGNELEEKNIALSRLDTLKDEFIANTTHELCTPLSGIIGIAESMIAGAVGDLSKRAVQNLEMLVASGKRLNGLVNNILDYSRLKNRDIQLQLSPLDIHGLSEIALKLLTPLAEAKGLRLVNGIRGETPLVMADENRLHQIYSNLIGNAIKYTPKGQITVFAEVLKDRMQISVKDTGMGIVEEKHKDIFLQFEQIRSKTSENIEGTGLGLSITRHLVELHGGVISLESLVGRGTTFYFTLPLADISKGAAAPLLSADMKLSRTAKIPIPVIIPEAPSHVSPLSGVKPVILIVDDDPINLQVAANHLIHEGFDVKTAPSGEQALRMIPPKNVPDLVLLDIMMPGMDGYEVCHRLRETHSMSALPIVMLTARNRPQDMVKGFEVGANDYLTKPFARGELLARVKAQLKLRCAYNVIKENASLKRTLAQHTEIREEIGSEKPLSHHLGDSDRKIPLQARTLPNETRPASNSMGLDKKELGVRVMSLAIHLWHHETGMTKIDLARQSGIWKVYMSKNGFERAQTLDKYLNTENFPKQPRWATVHDTVDFVLQSCKMPSPLRNQVENSILALKELG